MRLHASREARRRYGLGDFPVGPDGGLLVPSPRHARVLAARLRDVRDTAGTSWRDIRSGPIHALALINEIFHRVIAVYREERLPALDLALPRALADGIGTAALDAVLSRLAEEFPPPGVPDSAGAAALLRGAWPGRRPPLLAELLVLWLANRNPACEPLADLFDDEPLRRHPAFPALVQAAGAFFDAAPPLGPPLVDSEKRLIPLLRTPARVEPYSLPGQLRYIREHWPLLLERVGLLRDVLAGLDLLREEEEAFRLPPGADRPARSEVPDFGGLEGEAERFSADSDWMPRVVLLARNAHVWLAQLSRRHGRPIERLDEIPEGELRQLARWGITGLWLIGLWERSAASQQIKRMRGNPDAAASAYSIRDYAIAEELGGEAALAALRERAGRCGIRLASDMVPNHMGIDSSWVIEHPGRFLSVPDSPYPSYSFTGPDVSPDPAVGLFLEDHYADASDAAVVFRRIDRRHDGERFVYHGNDGTSTPWNDTAQLDYLNPATREAVIRTILDVARRFPIIRFDAAMTLTKRHYQRLWFPEPGTGGAIPSRADHGMTRSEFDARMPEEFWRDVVDRTAREAPGTLLLAEAFWLMEGYFVRSLGMHRVYNSAFMNMLRDEDNAKYRLVVRHTIAFDPEILGRYVNFMSNPDERTAIEQFGEGDKYFGVATLMATMPGLPMFGHGQIEGMTERYGMEFRRPYRDEEPNPALVARHETEIAPLLRRRELYAGSREFLLYDLLTPSGEVDENVFAYSNRAGGEAALVVYHNRFAETSGWIRESVPFRAQGGGRELRRRALAEGLGLPSGASDFVVFRDQVCGLEFVHPAREMHESGIHLPLKAYQRHVFLDFRVLTDRPGEPWRELAERLAGAGVPSAHAALRDLVLAAVRGPFLELAGPEALPRLLEWQGDGWAGRLEAFLSAAASLAVAPGSARDAAARSLEGLRRLVSLHASGAGGAWPTGLRPAVAGRSARVLEALRLPAFAGGLAGVEIFRGVAWLLQRESSASRPDVSPQTAPPGRASLGSGEPAEAALRAARLFVQEWGLPERLASGIEATGVAPGPARHAADGAAVLLPHARWFASSSGAGRPRPARAMRSLLDDPAVLGWIGVNTFDGVEWFHRESFESLLAWLAAFALLEAVSPRSESPPARLGRTLAERLGAVDRLREAMERSGHRLQELRAELARPRPRLRPPRHTVP